MWSYYTLVDEYIKTRIPWFSAQANIMLIFRPLVALTASLLALSVSVTGTPIDSDEILVDGDLELEDPTPQLYFGRDKSLEHEPTEVRSLSRIEGLLSLSKRQQCSGGPSYGICSVGPRRCCLFGSDCCYDGRCCEPGAWCYYSSESCATFVLALVLYAHGVSFCNTR